MVVTMLSDEQLAVIYHPDTFVFSPAHMAGLRAVEAAVRADMQPREVRTLEELDALPVGTVVMAPDGYATNLSDNFQTGEWMLPARILFTPTE